MSHKWNSISPAGVMIVDDQFVVRHIDSSLAKILDIDPAQLIGQNPKKSLDVDLKTLFDEEPSIRWSRSGGAEKILQRTKSEIPENNGSVIYCFHDVTETAWLRQENERLRQNITELTLTDELTGLANPRSFLRRLDAQVSHTRRYHNPLCIVVIEVVAITGDKTPSDDAILAISQLLRDRLRWVDMIARWEESQFILLLPETTAEDGANLIEKIDSAVSESALPQAFGNEKIDLRIGFAEWKQGYDARLLMQKAMDVLAQKRDPLMVAAKA